MVVLTLIGSCSGNGAKTDDVERTIGEGAALFESEGCVNCHGGEGQGLAGPRLAGGAVLETFPSCVEEMCWVSLGSARWGREVGATYGSTAKPVRGGMPGFDSRLDPEQIRQVVAYTRFVFGGDDPADVMPDRTG
jgi:mono/diheme cytochrome c family protein